MFICIFTIAVAVVFVMIMMQMTIGAVWKWWFCFGSVLARIEINLFLKVKHIQDLAVWTCYLFDILVAVRVKR